MTEIDQLSKSFRGKAAWDRFCDCFPSVDAAELLKVRIDADVAKVLLDRFADADKANAWLGAEIPALGGRSVLHTAELKHGARAIRALVMRLP